MGTGDPSAYLALPAAIRFVGGLHEEGWRGLRSANAALARDARDRLCAALGVDRPAPDAMLGAMASVPLPGLTPTEDVAERIQGLLFEEDRIEVPVMVTPVRAAREGDGGGSPQVVVRVSAQRYNRPAEYAYLADRLAHHVKRARGARSLLGRLRG
jgi:isopenicillin-N epimerase